MTSITFRVPAVPVAQPRARATTVNGQARMYEAKKSHAIHDFKASVRLAATQAYRGAPLTGPLDVSLVFVFPSKSKHRKLKPTKPDCDNLAKACLDCLNKLLYLDDGQVTCLCVEKYHAERNEQPHVLVTIEEVEA